MHSQAQFSLLKMDIFDTDTVQALILTFLWLEYLWELYLDVRQFQLCTKTKDVPPELQKVMTDETFNKARLYTIDKDKFNFVKGVYLILTFTLVIYSGALAVLWNYADSISPLSSEVATSCIWLFFIMTALTLLDLPFNIYYTFILEAKFGFNKQTSRFFIIDKIKSFLFIQILNLSVSSIIIVIVKYGGDWFFVWLWLAVGIIMLVLQTVYPTYIAPLFDKFTPLPEGELRDKIEALASQLNFPLGKLYIVEGSKRSAHSNAYFAGLFGNKSIVLFDTLLVQPERGGCQDDEILAVLSHELGHWKHGHIFKNLVIMELNLLLMFVAFGFTFRFPPIYQAVGFMSGSQPVIVGLLVVTRFILAPYNALLSFWLTCLSRRFEFQADAFALKLGKGRQLKNALVQLNKDNLGFPIYDKLFSAWHHSHPPLLQRIAALQAPEQGFKSD